MTIDEAIKHCLEVAEQNTQGLYDAIALGGQNPTQEEIANCEQCAADHRQLAEWLMELKDLRAEQNDQYVFIHELMSELKETKRLLKAAVEDMYNSVNDVHCKYCSKWHTDQCQGTSHLDCYVENKFKWRYADEVLALIGDESNEI